MIVPRCFLSWRAVPIRSTHLRVARSLWHSEAVEGRNVRRTCGRPKGGRGPQGQQSGTYCSEGGGNCHFDSNDRDKTDPGRVISQSRWRASRMTWPTRRGPWPLTRSWPPSSPKVVAASHRSGRSARRAGLEKARLVNLAHLARHTLFSLRSTLECVWLLQGWGVVVRLQKHRRQHGWTCPQPSTSHCKSIVVDGERSVLVSDDEDEGEALPHVSQPLHE